MVEQIRDNLINSGVNVEAYSGIDVDSIARSIENTTQRDLENHGFIVNATEGIVTFKMYNEDDIALNSEWFRWFAVKAHIVDLQPGEIAPVHSGFSITNAYKDMKVLVQGYDTRFNVRRRFVYVWNGCNLKEHMTTVEHEATRTAERNEFIANDRSWTIVVCVCITAVLIIGLVLLALLALSWGLFSFLSDILSMHYVKILSIKMLKLL